MNEEFELGWLRLTDKSQLVLTTHHVFQHQDYGIFGENRTGTADHKGRDKTQFYELIHLNFLSFDEGASPAPPQLAFPGPVPTLNIKFQPTRAGRNPT